MAALDIASLISSGLGGVLKSLFGGPQGLDPKTLYKYFGPGALLNDTNQLFQGYKSSPYGEFGMTNAALQGQQFGAELARRGSAIGGSGIGLLASSAASATQAYQQGNFLSGLYNQAGNAASQNLTARLSAFAQGGGEGHTPGAASLFSGIGNALGNYSLLTGNKNPGTAPGAMGPASYREQQGNSILDAPLTRQQAR